MPFYRLYCHLVWTTKGRQPFIPPKVELRLYSYLSNKAMELGVRVYAINGWTEHVHMIVGIPPKHAVAYVVKSLKGASAFDLNHTVELSNRFQWQRGYGALSLGETQRPTAVAYVENQKQHHQHQTTNMWLERVAEFDEGPDDLGLTVGPVSNVVREARAPYGDLVDVPFPF